MNQNHSEPLKIKGRELFEVLATANYDLLSIDDEEQAIIRTLKTLGKYGQADRAYLFKNYFDEELQKDYCSHLTEWHNTWLAPQSGDPVLKKFFYENQKMEWLIDRLRAGEVVEGHLEDLPKENHKLLKDHHIKSVLIHPIFIRNEFWGFIGMDACRDYVEWSDGAKILLENMGTALALYFDKYELNRHVNRQKEFFKTILENSNEGISVLDREGKIIYQSPSNAQVIGYSNEEARDTDYFSLIHPEDLKKAKNMYAKIFADPGNLYSVVVRYKHSHGHYIKMELEVINLLTTEAINGVVVNFRDISKSEDYKEKLVQNQRMLKSAQSIAKIGSYEFDLINNTVLFSDELWFIHGLTPADNKNESTFFEELSAFVHADDREYVKKTTEEGFFNGTGYAIEYRIITPSGELKYLYSIGEMVLGEQNVPLKIIGTTQDITDRKKREEQIKEISMDLTRKNKELETFAYVTSHNLRSPISNLKGLCSLLEEDDLSANNKNIIQKFVPLLDQLDRSLTDIVQNINSLNNSADQLSQVNLKNAYKEVEIEIYDLIEESGASVDLEFDKAASIHYYKSHIHNIFLNMLTNSIKYRKPGTDLKIKIRSYREEGQTVLEFSDNGLGIDLEKNGHRIFKMYQRFGVDKNIDGKGLGLYIVKQQVEQHDGTIDVESKPGEGTKFIISLRDQHA